MDQLSNKIAGMNVTSQGWNALWQNESVNLMAEKEIRTKWLQHETIREQQKQQQKPQIGSPRDLLSCDINTMRSTLKKIPDTASLLQKCRLPLGLILHPFRNDVSDAML